MSTASYQEFLNTKTQAPGMAGFEPLWIPDWLFPFQSHLEDWSIRNGRCLIAADCGLGKTPLQLVWSENVVRHTNGRVLLVTPLGVAPQTLREAEKFGVGVVRSKDGKFASTAKIVVTNYERLHYFNPADFIAFVGDESSIVKNCNGKTRLAITEFMRRLQFRLFCTATAAPNDYFELGTSSEALGYLGYQDLLTKFFKEEMKKDLYGWGRKTYHFRGHAEQPFWKYVCSWARACRKPSDLGFDDNGFILPALIEREHIVEKSTPRAGMLFSIPAHGAREKREERRVSLRERCECAAELAANHDGASVTWCHYNPEGKLLAKLTPEAVEVCGSMDDDEKEEKLLGFQIGQIKRLVTKPKIGCFGLNWQHCHNVICFPSDSYEQYYQLVRRCYRFGQEHPVTVTTVATEGEQGTLKNLQRKANQSDRMFTSLMRHMTDPMHIDDGWNFNQQERMPAWLS